MERQLTLEEVKRVQYGILCATADFCDQNHIRYFLTGGTLLGAVRHQGFIPWDDDIDIQIPRPDYDRLIELADGAAGKSLPAHLFLSTMENNPAHARMFARMIDNRVVYQNRFYQERYTSNLGIDIFPMDGAPEKGSERKRYFRKMRCYKKCYDMSQSRAFVSTNPFRAVIKTVVAIPAKLVGRDYFYHKVSELARKYPYAESDEVGITTAVYMEKELFPRRAYEDVEDVVFEDRAFHSIRDRDGYLRQLYGDYMRLPPESERVRKHGFTAWMDDND